MSDERLTETPAPYALAKRKTPDDEKLEARRLYVKEGKTMEEVSQITGIKFGTICSWSANEAWREARKAWECGVDLFEVEEQLDEEVSEFLSKKGPGIYRKQVATMAVLFFKEARKKGATWLVDHATGFHKVHQVITEAMGWGKPRTNGGTFISAQNAVISPVVPHAETPRIEETPAEPRVGNPSTPTIDLPPAVPENSSEEGVGEGGRPGGQAG